MTGSTTPGKLTECRYVGCTRATHRRLGVHVAINARAGELWRNDQCDREEIERSRDAQNLRRIIDDRVRIYQFGSRWFRRRFSHYLARHDD